jgi:hypothetical protein
VENTKRLLQLVPGRQGSRKLELASAWAKSHTYEEREARQDKTRSHPWNVLDTLRRLDPDA